VPYSVLFRPLVSFSLFSLFLSFFLSFFLSLSLSLLSLLSFFLSFLFLSLSLSLFLSLLLSCFPPLFLFFFITRSFVTPIQAGWEAAKVPAERLSLCFTSTRLRSRRECFVVSLQRMRRQCVRARDLAPFLNAPQSRIVWGKTSLTVTPCLHGKLIQRYKITTHHKKYNQHSSEGRSESQTPHNKNKGGFSAKVHTVHAHGSVGAKVMFSRLRFFCPWRPLSCLLLLSSSLTSLLFSLLPLLQLRLSLIFLVSLLQSPPLSLSSMTPDGVAGAEAA